MTKAEESHFWFSFFMMMTIYGEDTFRSREFLNATIHQFRKKRDPEGLNIHRFDATQTPLSEIARLEGMGGLFGAGKRFFVIERLEEASYEMNELKTFVESRRSLEGSVVCFYLRGTVGGAMGKLLTSVGFVYSFKTLGGSELEIWIRNRSLRYGSEISRVLAGKLALRFGGNLWAIDRELASLSGLARGGVITESLYCARERESGECSLFEFAESLLAGNRKRAAALGIRGGFKEWIPFVMLFASYVRGILWLKERSRRGGGEGALPLNPYFVKKLSRFEPRLTVPELESMIESLVDVDRKMKTIPVAPDTLVLSKLLK